MQSRTWWNLSFHPALVSLYNLFSSICLNASSHAASRFPIFCIFKFDYNPSSVHRYFALSKVNPSTLLRRKKNDWIHFPICASQRDLFLAIYNPSNNRASAPISKRNATYSYLMSFQKRRGRVNSVTSPPHFYKLFYQLCLVYIIKSVSSDFFETINTYW